MSELLTDAVIADRAPDFLVGVVAKKCVDTERRLGEARAAHRELQQQMVAINARGVEVERMILGLEGELKALRELSSGE